MSERIKEVNDGNFEQWNGKELVPHTRKIRPDLQVTKRSFCCPSRTRFLSAQYFESVRRKDFLEIAALEGEKIYQHSDAKV